MVAALEGVRVLDMGRLGPSAMVSMMLADFGAEVISVTAETDPIPVAPSDDFWGFQGQMKMILRALNRNKQSITLNLKDAADHATFLKLADRSDVVIDDFRPGTADRLGVGFDVLSPRNPGLSYCALSGYGQDSAMGDQPGHDLNFIAKAGLLDLIGRSDQPPTIPLFFLSDFAGAAMHGFSGILLALLARHRTQRGQFIDISFSDTALTLVNPLAFHILNGGAAPRRGELLYSGSYPHYSVYPCKDGGYVAVGCFEPWLWNKFCAAVGLPDLAQTDMTEPAARVAAREVLETLFRTQTAAHWEAELGPQNVCVTAVHTLSEMLKSDHVRQHQLIAQTDHPRHGTERHLANTISLSLTPARIHRAAPDPGRAPGLGRRGRSPPPPRGFERADPDQDPRRGRCSD
ncbi:MAG: CaiB/BaiF CoA-transferase family protein, partial [Gemmobacter sp.]|nr:CaiB/BaiF CoA-transferase family protein [Gemmobacter sp.]